MGCIPIMVDPGVFALSTPDCSLHCILGRAISGYILTLEAAPGTKLAGSARQQFCEQTSSVFSQEPPRCQHGCRQPSRRPWAVVKTAVLCWSEGVLDYDCWWSC